MSVRHRVLGEPFGDNALYATVEPGQNIHRLLFDCGMGCLEVLRNSDIMAIDHLFFSHFHIDHIAGFDLFLRLNYARDKKPVRLWGPEGSIEILHHRLLGYTWDMVEDLPGEWVISEISEHTIRSVLLKTCEGFRKQHDVRGQKHNGTIFSTSEYKIEVKILEHRTTSLAYKVSEHPQYHIDQERLDAMDFVPGPWIKIVKDMSVENSKQVEINGSKYQVGHLRERLLTKDEGDILVYMTDFIYPQDDRESLLSFLADCDILICESTYRSAQQSLAKKNYHLTSEQAALLARGAGVRKLILFHISDRYSEEGLQPFLSEASKIFPQTYLPAHWPDSVGE